MVYVILGSCNSFIWFLLKIILPTTVQKMPRRHFGNDVKNIHIASDSGRVCKLSQIRFTFPVNCALARDGTLENALKIALPAICAWQSFENVSCFKCERGNTRQLSAIFFINLDYKNVDWFKVPHITIVFIYMEKQRGEMSVFRKLKKC